ncbi:MAG: GNAT family N-acetyltransferase [Pseudonocardiales bacterium]|nr:GNAT family N-acetyltransferase [Pseudonocardiales bacterium]MBV9029282.1 GNAT family N-acetyltransferase [Pseudonocardiales bacterium]
MSVEAEGVDARPAWENLVAHDESIALSKTPEWADCICSSSRFSDATLLFRGDDGRHLILPRLRRTGTPPLLGLFESPPQGWGLGADASGLLSEGGPASPSQTWALIQEIRRRPGLRTRVMVGGDDAAAWASAAPGTIYSTALTAQVLDLRGGFSTVWSERFTSKVRSNARKAERRGVVVESDSTGRLVPVFDGLYRSSVDRWAQERGHPLSLMRWRAQRRDPQSKFATVARRMGERCTVWIAWRGGEPLAGIFVLTRGPRATYWRGAMNKELARGTGANELLHRHAIEAACADERQSYDFGLYQTEELKRFKSTFGAREVPVRAYYFETLPTVAAEARCHNAAKQAVLAVVRLARTGR